VRLLQVVGQVHGIEVVAFLIGLVDLAFAVLGGRGQLNQILLVNVLLAAVIEGTCIYTVEYSLEAVMPICAFGVIPDVFFNCGWTALGLREGLCFGMLWNKLVRHFHESILGSSPG
jgi:hypothetical protein